MRTSHRSAWPKSLLISWLTLSFAGFSTNAKAGEPDDAAKQQARELMTHGRQERAHADLRAALQSFSQADEIMHVPTTGFEVAQTLSALGLLVEAAAAVARVEALPERANEPEAFGTARQAAKDLGHDLEARTPLLHITYPESTDPTHLTLDGKPLEPTAAFVGVRVNPGRHVATASRGTLTRHSEIDVTEKSTPEVAFAFAPEENPPQAAEESAPRRPRTNQAATIAVYSLTSVAVVGLGAGLGLGLWSNHHKTQLEQQCAPDCTASSVSQLKHDYLLANVAAGIGAAAGLAAITVYVLGPDSPSSKEHHAHASVSLAASAGSAPGVMVTGTF